MRKLIQAQISQTEAENARIARQVQQAKQSLAEHDEAAASRIRELELKQKEDIEILDQRVRKIVTEKDKQIRDLIERLEALGNDF